MSYYDQWVRVCYITLKIKSIATRVICCASFPGDLMNLLNEQVIQGSGVNEFTDHDHNSDSVRQATVSTPSSSSSTLVSIVRGLPSLSKN